MDRCRISPSPPECHANTLPPSRRVYRFRRPNRGGSGCARCCNRTRHPAPGVVSQRAKSGGWHHPDAIPFNGNQRNRLRRANETKRRGLGRDVNPRPEQCQRSSASRRDSLDMELLPTTVPPSPPSASPATGPGQAASRLARGTSGEDSQRGRAQGQQGAGALSGRKSLPAQGFEGLGTDHFRLTKPEVSL